MSIASDSQDMFLKMEKLQRLLTKVEAVTNCAVCGKSINILNKITRRSSDGTKVTVCKDCKTLFTEKEKRQQLEILIANAPKIKCPYCDHLFPKLTSEQYRDGIELQMLNYSIIPEWGVFIGELQGKHYVECPFCKMKIPQD